MLEYFIQSLLLYELIKNPSTLLNFTQKIAQGNYK